MGQWVYLARIAHSIAATPNGLDVVVAAGHLRQFFAQMTDKNIDDLELRLVDPAIEVAENHPLGHNAALAQTEQLEDAVFLAGQSHRLVICRDNAGLEIDDKVSGSDCRLASGTGYPAGNGHPVRDSKWTHSNLQIR